MSQPLFIILAGPNGAGKSTAASRLLPSDVAFVNAYEIAKTLPSYPSRAADVEAGRLALERLENLERVGADFAVETTLAGRSLAARAARLKSIGYFVALTLYGRRPLSFRSTGLRDGFDLAGTISLMRRSGGDLVRDCKTFLSSTGRSPTNERCMRTPRKEVFVSSPWETRIDPRRS